MGDKNKSKAELIRELIQLRKRNIELEQYGEKAIIQEKKYLLKESLEQKATDKYLKLFNSIDQGFFVIDVIFDENDIPVDLYYVEANTASIKILGCDYTNRYLKDINPNYESYWFNMFGEVAITGKSVRMEQYAEPDKKWYSFYLFKIGDKNSRTIGNIFLDITERKRTEDALRETEEKLRTVLENSRDGINMFDLKTGKSVYMSPSQVALTGFTAEEINNFSVDERFERIHPDDQEISINQYKQALAGFDTMEAVEYRWKVKNGEYRWFSDKRKLVRDKNGQPVASVGISRDITDQKENENKLAFQAKILSNVKDSITVLDENNKIIYCNKSAVKLFGWQEQELIGRSCFDFVQYYVGEALQEKIVHTLEDIKKEFITIDEDQIKEIRCLSKDGTLLILDLDRAVIRDPKDVYKGLILSTRDVSKRYKNELELRKSEERYRYLFNNIDEGFAIFEIVYDKKNKPYDFRYIELNPAYEKTTGIIIKDVLGKTLNKLKYNFEDYWYKAFIKVTLTGESIRILNESKKLNKWFDMYIFKINLENGTKLGLLINDVTDKIMHNLKLEKLIKMQDDLYVNVSHELKTPLNVIFSANQVMNMHLINNSIIAKNEVLINYNNIIKQNCYRLTKLINNIVDLSKSNSGLLNINLINIDIVDFIKNIVQSISEYVKLKELTITFDTNVDVKIIACDPEKIERVMLNLISNAIKFSNPNSEILINVNALSKSNTFEIAVKDTGIGIEKQNLDNIFNKFYQEDKSLSRHAEGNGIGLSLVKSLVEMHGGNVSVESELNKGSIFKVELPARTIDILELKERVGFINKKIDTIEIEFSDIYSNN